MTLNSLLITVNPTPPFPHREENRNVKISYEIDKFFNKALTTKIYSPWRRAAPLNVVIRATRRSSRWQRKGSTFIFQLSSAFKPLDPNTNSPDWSTYISLKNWSRKFVYISKIFPPGDYFTDSHNIFPWLCLDFVGRKLNLVTLAT